jgi:hypothetical protein
MNTGFLSIPWLVWGILSLVVAGIFAIFVPAAEKVNAAVGLQFIIVRWFHSLCWLLIASNFFLRALGDKNANGIANLLGAIGGVVYVIYIITFVQVLKI